jgi:hypothetical protein
MSKSGAQNPNIEIRNPKVYCKLTGEKQDENVKSEHYKKHFKFRYSDFGFIYTNPL